MQLFSYALDTIRYAARSDFMFDHSLLKGILKSIFMEKPIQSETSLLARLRTGWSALTRVLASPDFCRKVAVLLRPAQTQAEAKPVELPPERRHASGLAVLSLLQREGRLIDFLQEEVTAFSDAEVGAAARVVHAGCNKVFKEYFTVEPILKDAEGATVKIPAGFDAQRIRISGNVAGQPPFRGTLKHHGWEATGVRLPAVSDALDPRVLVAAEVEL